MVIASVLSYLKSACGYDNLTILAVHIDYANRPESGAEADYVRRYCEDQLGGNIEFSCRRIDEVTRGITARDDYERIAREIRYTSYREAVARTKEIMGLVSKEEELLFNPLSFGSLWGHHLVLECGNDLLLPSNRFAGEPTTRRGQEIHPSATNEHANCR